ncbi:MAG: hypothetical protein KAH31_09385 [Candidatus Sabulitectum sp.]|nr:hypothetical protein [Candidatus Sabulitectum sp.]
MAAVLIYLTALCSTFTVEAIGGLVVPGTPQTHGPAVFCEFRAGIDVSENWTVFAAIPFWKLSNFNPSSTPPEFYEYEEYNWFENYSESRLGYQIGAERCMGPFSLEAAAGVVKRTAEYSMAGADVDGCGDTEYNESLFLGSLGIVIPTGNYGLFNLGLRTEDFDHWFFSIGAGLTVSSDTFTGTGGE